MPTPGEPQGRCFDPTPESEMDEDRRLRVLLNRFFEEKFYVGADGFYWYDGLVYDEDKGPESARLVTERTKIRAVSVTTAGLSVLAKDDIMGIMDFFSEIFDQYRAATDPRNDLRRLLENSWDLFEVYFGVEIQPIKYVRRGDHFTIHGERYIITNWQRDLAVIIENQKSARKVVSGMLVYDEGSFRRGGETA